MIKWLREYLQVRKEYKQFITDCKREQDLNRKYRPEAIRLDYYPYQEGMLPKDWELKQPKATGKHFNDYKWPKSSKK